MKVYLAGPMRGIPDFNFPAFRAATERLRKFGYEVHSPAEEDINNGFDPTGLKGDDSELGPAGFNLAGALAADLNYVLNHAQAVVVLPGWEKSNGANAEVYLARAVGKEVMTLARALNEEEPEEVGSPREQSLRRAIGYVVGDRNNSYGPPTQDFQRTAALWTALGFRVIQHEGAEPQPVRGHHVAQAMILLKQSRLVWQPGKADSWDDTSGYASCGYETALAESN